MKKLLYFLITITFISCEKPTTSPNSPETFEKPFVVLVSIDGFRYDYVEKYDLPNLKRIAQEGVAAEGVLPVFPSKTFPNHYSIVTGLYPSNHGLVSNTFYDPDKEATYRISDREKVADGSWYGGTPLWVLAEQQGMKAASYFWVGSEAAIQGTRPSYYFPYDGRVPHANRVNQVINWLKLSKEKRPHFITLYFSVIDSRGHAFGPDSKEVEEALKDMDETIADLDARIEALDMPVNLIITSDHGMTRINQQNPIRLDNLVDLSKFIYASAGTFYMLYSDNQADIDEAYQQLIAEADHYDVYKKEDIPEYLKFSGNKRIGDLLVMASPPYVITHGPELPASPGTHGYDAQLLKDMHTIFYAKGSAFKAGMSIPTFENIHIYPMIAHILGLKYEGIDGRFEVLQPILEGE